MVAAVALAVGVLSQVPAPPEPQSASGGANGRPPARAAGPVSVEVGPVGPVLGRSVPRRVTVPALGISSSLERLHLRSDDTMAVPRDPDRAGWFVRSPTPGALGPSVIAGHVTWNGDRSVFFELGRMRPGQRIEVDRRDGRTAVFEVTRVRQFAKRHFPTDAVYGSTRRAELRLITCGGTYDEATHRYADNVVVFARLVAGGGTA